MTNLARFAVEGYEVNASGFLIKPVSYPDFCLQLDRILRRLKMREEKELVIKGKGHIYKVSLNSLFYVEVSGMELKFHTSDGVITARGSLNKYVEELAEDNFVPINSCYLVNLRHVNSVKKDMVCVNGQELKISRSKKKSFVDALTDYLGGGRS